MLSIFQRAIKFDYQFLAIFQSFFFWFMTSIFDQLGLPIINVSKYALNRFLILSSAKNSLKSAKNVEFTLFSILVGRPMGMGGATANGYATAYIIYFWQWIFDLKILSKERWTKEKYPSSHLLNTFRWNKALFIFWMLINCCFSWRSNVEPLVNFITQLLKCCEDISSRLKKMVHAQLFNSSLSFLMSLLIVSQLRYNCPRHLYHIKFFV